MATIAQQFRQEGIELGIYQGRQEGIELGMQRGRLSMAYELAKKGMGIPFIRDVTHLTDEEIESFINSK